jgi:hypothetical protein
MNYMHQGGKKKAKPRGIYQDASHEQAYPHHHA